MSCSCCSEEWKWHEKKNPASIQFLEMATTTAIKEPKLKDIRRNDISRKRHIILD
jgi:hypothetical protein